MHCGRLTISPSLDFGGAGENRTLLTVLAKHRRLPWNMRPRFGWEGRTRTDNQNGSKPPGSPFLLFPINGVEHISYS